MYTLTLDQRRYLNKLRDILLRVRGFNARLQVDDTLLYIEGVLQRGRYDETDRNILNNLRKMAVFEKELSQSIDTTYTLRKYAKPEPPEGRRL